jgi:hypothetical protein
MPGEDPYHHQPPAPIDLIGAPAGSGRPRHSTVGGDGGGTHGVEVVDETHQFGPEGGQLEPQPAAHRQVFFGSNP